MPLGQRQFQLPSQIGTAGATPVEGQRRQAASPGIIGRRRGEAFGQDFGAGVEIWSEEAGAWVPEADYVAPGETPESAEPTEAPFSQRRNQLLSTSALARRRFTGLGGRTIRTSQRGVIGQAQVATPSLIGVA